VSCSPRKRVAQAASPVKKLEVLCSPSREAATAASSSVATRGVVVAAAVAVSSPSGQGEVAAPPFDQEAARARMREVEEASGPLPAREEVAFVTGGNSGIGKEIARKLAKAGFRVVLGCKDLASGAAAVQEFEAQGLIVKCTYLELNDLQSMVAARSFVYQHYKRLDILVSNAAICFNDPTLYGKQQFTSFEKQAPITINTNFFGTLNVVRTMLVLLRASPSPRLIFLSSSAGRLAILKSEEKKAAFTSPTLQVREIETLMRQFVADVEAGVHADRGWGHTCYGMTKLGLIALSRVLARDEPTMMVNCADPGYCATEMNAFQGDDPPEKGARTAAMLALLPNSPHITGKIFWNEALHRW